MDVEEILAKIRAFCEERTRESSVIRKAREKIAGGKATYAEAQKVAMEEGRILEEAFAKYLPEALTNGYLYREFAEKLVKVPVRDQAKEVTRAAEDVQKALNEAAGIGIRPIVPELNREQLDGIVTGICNENFERGKSEFFSQVENFMEGHVDDFVRENADFQYKTGLSPTVTRIADRKCCPWCNTLSGTYRYDDVSDKGNDVWRRHKNCHCVIEFNPGRGYRKKATKSKFRWTQEDEDARIAYENMKKSLNPVERGFEEAKAYGKTWQKGSLQEAVAKFAPNATPVSDDSGRKIVYVGEKYTVGYDTGGNYFRIMINDDGSKRPFVNLDGSKVLNIEENGKQRGATKPEYEAMTHFRNTDTERRR